MSFLDQVHEEGNKGMIWPQLKTLLSQIAAGVAHLHGMAIAHCDLKPENITVSESGCAKLVDFGQAVDETQGIPELKVPRGSMPFVAPEVLRLSPQWLPVASDLWQIGVILFEMLCGNKSFVQIMDWRGLDLMSFDHLPQRAQELERRFGDNEKASTLAQVHDAAEAPPSPLAMQLLMDLLQLTPAKRLPASSVERCLGENP
jgi:serine/threonine protein kinase